MTDRDKERQEGREEVGLRKRERGKGEREQERKIGRKRGRDNEKAASVESRGRRGEVDK